MVLFLLLFKVYVDSDLYNSVLCYFLNFIVLSVSIRFFAGMALLYCFQNVSCKHCTNTIPYSIRYHIIYIDDRYDVYAESER